MRAVVLVHGALVVGVVAGVVPLSLWRVWADVGLWWPSAAEWAWWSGAALAVLAGVWLALWALVGDPARGRRRCPRCWYDMGGVGGTVCPECGCDARSERRLGRTRRRWWWAAAGMGLCAAAAALAAGPRVADGTWPEHVPDVVLAAVWPWLPDGSDVQERAVNRLCYGLRPEGWRGRRIGAAARAGLRRDDRPLLLIHSIAMLESGDLDEATEERLIALAHHRDPNVRGQALNLAGVLVPNPERLVPHAVANLGDANQWVVTGALNALIAIGWDSAEGIDVPAELVALARSSAVARVRAHAVKTLGTARPTEEVMALLLASAEDPEPRIRAAALSAIARRDPDRERAQLLLLRGRDDADLGVRVAALAAIARDGPRTPATLAAVERMTDQEMLHYEASSVVYSLARAPAPLEQRLRILRSVHLAHQMSVTAGHMRGALMSMEGEEDEAVRVLTEWEARAEAEGDERGARWCALARAWVEQGRRSREAR